MIKDILSGEDQVMLTRYVDYNTEQVDQFIADIKDTLMAHDELKFLCANQIGINAAIFALKCDDGCAIFINPAIESSGNDSMLSRECSVYNDKQYLIFRPTKLTLYYVTENKNATSHIFEGDLAALIQKIIFCLQGIDCNDFGLEVTEEFDNADEEQKQEVISAYKAEIDKLFGLLDEELSTDEQVKNAWTSFKFNEAANSGEIEFTSIDKPTNRSQRRFIDKLRRKKK